MTSPAIHRLSTPRAAAAAGVLFAVLFGTALVLIRLALPEGEEPGAQWLETGSTNLKVAATIMPFAGIAFLWFMGVVRDGLGRYEDKFFSTVFIGSGLLFLAMMFVAAGVGAGLADSWAAVASRLYGVSCSFSANSRSEASTRANSSHGFSRDRARIPRLLFEAKSVIAFVLVMAGNS